MSDLPRVCVVGYGVAGKLHHRLLEAAGLRVCAVDPALTGTPLGVHRRQPVEHSATVRDMAGPVHLWSLCTPTQAHVDVLAQVLERDPRARVIMEKPACRVQDVPRLLDLLERHPGARVVVMNQYRHAHALRLLDDLRRHHMPDHPVTAVRVAFSKDRRPDMEAGRFVDRDHGVFGYEWPHMLAVASRLLPSDVYRAYVESPVEDVRGVVHEDYFVTAARERAVVADGVELELYSSVVGDALEDTDVPDWARPFGHSTGGRRRLAQLQVGPALFTAEMDPVALPDGSRLPSNTHRLTAELPGGCQETLVNDSPMDNALRTAVARLLGDLPLPPVDLRPVHRISALAGHFRHVPATAAAAAGRLSGGAV
ncbi:Gfo/Idh/MocA family oxidoreductase [Streptomyces incarnatus]|uniref:Gfo/Idh/MocA family oxidoreductase n=1 Tax=unclassified Streptomyces TaxID=2593676 RepID=UPI001F1A11CC|nr:MULTISPECIES: Gfo/Idh/MocA family oxidoreductase [Streptomyces]WKE67564.1 Gfo/Idh/MocA family oxidoreductase [Streptomyces sp. WP-1]